jgi:hypothetical protein
MALRARRRTRAIGIVTSAAMALSLGMTVVGGGRSFAVSDGHYRYWENGCSGSADNSTSPTSTQPGCKNLIFTVFDDGGHEYFGAGIPQTADGTAANEMDFWADPGLGKDVSWTLSASGGLSGVSIGASTQPAANPASGLKVYFGADDNLDVGEHDSSGYVNNGPSDGGGIVVNVSPVTAAAWVSALRAADLPALLVKPVPFNGGMGACADGFCISINATRKLAYRGLNTSIHRDAADYVWSNGQNQIWKPYNCAGPSDGSDGSNVCDVPAMHKQLGAANPCYNINGYMTLACWNQINGAVWVEPGVQIYEDPDPQASPGLIDTAFSANGILPQVYSQSDPDPWPAIYAGTCGIVIGGGPNSEPTHLTLPGTNTAGQYAYQTGCS